MGFFVDLLDLRDGELGVALRGAEALVAEELLDGAEVGALLKHVGAEGVAQGVRVDIRGQASLDGDGLDDAADAAGGEAGGIAAGGGVDEEWAGGNEARFAAGFEFCFAFGQVRSDGFGCCVTKGDVALFAALAADEDGIVGPVDVSEVDADQLGVADAAAVEELPDDAVAVLRTALDALCA